MNEISATLFYNTRIVLSAPIETPVTWHCSKVEQISPKGISHITFAQDKWDANKDAFQYEWVDPLTHEVKTEFTSVFYSDRSKKIVGIWADYFSAPATPTTPNKPVINIWSKITYSGVKAEAKVGGNFKKLTVSFYNEDEQIPTKSGNWNFYIDESDASSLITTEIVSDSQIKFKFTGGDSYIGKVLKVNYTSDDGISTDVDFSIIGL